MSCPCRLQVCVCVKAAVAINACGIEKYFSLEKKFTSTLNKIIYTCTLLCLHSEIYFNC